MAGIGVLTRYVVYCSFFFVVCKVLTHLFTSSRTPICGVYETTRGLLADTCKALPDPSKILINELLKYESSSRICPGDDPGIVIIVDTARNNTRERNLIRKTWGSLKSYAGFWIRVVFLVGQSEFCICETNTTTEFDNYQNEHDNLCKEQLLSSDIVIGAFVDSYRNLTYKHLMGYKFVLDDCPGAKFLVKTDDDMFVNVPKIISTLQEVENLADIYCRQYHDKPTRNKEGKWFSTREEWPEDTYPLYCLGNGYFMTAEWVQSIYSVRNLGGFFWVDDVFITGKLREIAERQVGRATVIQNIKANLTDKRDQPEILSENCGNPDVDLGYFVFLSRDWESFETIMDCLWRGALQKS